MATPQSVMVVLAGLHGVFHKTVPKFPVEVHTIIRVCLPATPLILDASHTVHFTLLYYTENMHWIHRKISTSSLNPQF